MNISSIASALTGSAPIGAIDAARVDVRQNVAQQASDSGRVQTQQAVQQPAQPKAAKEDVEKAVKEVNDFLKPLNNSLQFNIDEDTGQTVVKVIDSSTKEIIRQFPSEEMLSIAKAIDKMKGLLVQQKA